MWIRTTTDVLVNSDLAVSIYVNGMGDAVEAFLLPADGEADAFVLWQRPRPEGDASSPKKILNLIERALKRGDRFIDLRQS